MSFTVYRSSAGSGKTFSLTKEYLALALSDEQQPPRKFKSILAITFTNKAAAEMKERIMKALRELSQNEYTGISESSRTLAAALQAELKIPRHELSARAESVLKAILHQYSDFAVGTIDSFTHRIIRTFARDLHLPLNFEVKMDADELLSEAIALLISRIGSDEKLTKALVEFSESKADEEKNWDIEYDLVKFAGNLLKEDGQVHLQKLRTLTMDDFFSIRKEIVETVKKFETLVITTAKKAFSLILSGNITAEAFYQGRNGIHTYFRKLASGDVDYIEPNSHVTATLKNNRWSSSKASAADIARIEKIKPALAEAASVLEKALEKEFSRYVLCREIGKRIYSLAVLNEIEKIIDEHKKENNILHISEFNRIISGIAMSQPVPFIYERMGEKYSHFLLDEFQDTSVLQWHNLLPLIDNSLAENNFNMLVGDGKQSIYRWRGSEVELFAKLPAVPGADCNELLKEREHALKNHFRLKKLDANFRSRRELVEFNNRFFRFASENFLPSFYSGIYSDLEQKAAGNSTGGFIAIEFLGKETVNEDEIAAQKTIKLVKELKDEGFSLKDIAVITRNNKEGAWIASCLLADGIKVISSESLLLKNSGEVNFILNMLRFLDNPADAVARTAALQYLIETNKIKNNSLHRQITSSENENPVSYFTEQLKKNGFAVNIPLLLKMPLVELCETLIRLFSLGKQAAAYMQFFMDEVFAFSLKNPDSISEFFSWWESRSEKASLVVPDALDAVNIMTIHRSKGLEFPVVIMPYANWKMDKGKDELWVNVDEKTVSRIGSAIVPNTKALEKTACADVYAEENSKAVLDNINLLYVAMTRPSERLYMITTFPRVHKNISKIFTAFLAEQGIWDENKLYYSFGKALPHKSKNNREQQHFSLPEYAPSDWRQRVHIRQNAKEVWDDSPGKRSSGILMHNALARISDYTRVNDALDAMMNEGLIDPAEAGEMRSRINSLLSLPGIKPFFEKGLIIKNESELLLPGGKIFRPDRVILQNKSVIVIDYKTGSAKDEHKKQLLKYASLLEKMGFEKVEKYLLYISELRLEKLQN